MSPAPSDAADAADAAPDADADADAAVASRYDALLCALAEGRTEPVVCLSCGDDAAVFAFRGRSGRLAVFRYRDDEGAVLEAMRAFVDASGSPALLVLVGGPRAAVAMLDAALPPRWRRAGFGTAHWAGDGRLQRWGAMGDAAVFDDLRPVDAERAAEARRTLQADADGATGDARAAEAAQAAFDARRPLATNVLGIGMLVLAFATMYWGRSGHPTVLIHAGSLLPEAVYEGEYWRLLSATLLHLDVEHWLGNLLLLASVGTLLERTLGTSRFLVLYVASALVGSLASLQVLGDGMSVGASGALWGLFVVHAWIAFRRPELWPRKHVRTGRRRAAIYLVLGAAVSFLPQVDLAAHVGGAVTGLLLVGSGWLLEGVRSPVSGPELRTVTRTRLAAAVGVSCLLGSGVHALAAGRPWSVVEPMPPSQRVIVELGAVVDVPDNLGAYTLVQHGPSSVASFGALPRDVATIEVGRWSLPPSGSLRSDPEGFALAALRSVGDLPEHTLQGEPQRVEGPGDLLFEARYTVFERLSLSRCVRLDGQDMWRVDVLTWGQTSPLPGADRLWAPQACAIARSASAPATPPGGF